MKQRKLTALALALAMCLSVLPAGAFAAEEEARDTDFFTPQEHTELKYEDLEYARPDGEAILAKIQEIRDLLDDEANMEKVSALFDDMGEDFTLFQTMYSLCNIQAYQDVNSTAWDELETLGDMASQLSDQLSILMKEILDSPCAPFLEAQLDEESIEYYKGYTPMTEEQLSFASQEAALESEYQTAVYTLPTVEVDGVAYDADSIYLAYAYGEVDYETYDAVATQLAQEKNAILGEIYLRMVALRQAEAKSYGYDNYAEYAYAEIYTRDYTPEEIRPFHAAVKEYIAPLYQEVYASYTNYYYAGAYDEINAMDYSGETALDMVEPYLTQMSDELVEAFTFMREGGYYDNSISGVKASAGFTTSLPTYGAPFFFLSGSGGVYDFNTAVHEFGHYDSFYWSSNDFIDYVKNIDISEVHSQGMELLFTHWYPEIFGETGGDAMETYLMLNLLSSILEGCLHDELQQYVYYTPDVTLQQINQKYRALMTEYGQVDAADPRDEMYSWVDIAHTFTDPCYYISYAVSAAGAFAFWLDAQSTDYYEALDNYLAFTALPGSYDFSESFEQVGLETPTDPAYIQALADDLYWELFGMPMPGSYDVAVSVNGEFLKFPDAQPTIVNSRTMLPVRAVVESMGAQVEWDNDTRKVTITLGDTVVTLTIGSNEITVEKGGETTTVSMDVAPFIDSGRTYVPVRFISEAFGFQVDWDNDYRTAIILDLEGVVAQAMEGKEYTYLEKLLAFLTKTQEGKDQGIWNVSADIGGTLTEGAMEVPVTGAVDAVVADGTQLEMDMNMTMDLTQLMTLSALSGAAPDAETRALINALAQEGLGIQMRGDVDGGKFYFTLSDQMLTTMGVEPGTWFLMDMNAMAETAGMDPADLPVAEAEASLAADDTVAALIGLLGTSIDSDGTMSVGVAAWIVDQIQSVAAFLADDAFVAGEDTVTTVVEFGGEAVSKLVLTLQIQGDEVTGASMALVMSNYLEGIGEVLNTSLDLTVDETGAVQGDLILEVYDMAYMDFTFHVQATEGDAAPQTEPPAGATVLDLSDPAVMDQLMGIMPLPEEAA